MINPPSKEDLIVSIIEFLENDVIQELKDKKDSMLMLLKIR